MNIKDFTVSSNNKQTVIYNIINDFYDNYHIDTNDKLHRN